MPISSALGKVGLGGWGIMLECFVFNLFFGLGAGASETNPKSHSCIVAACYKKKVQMKVFVAKLSQTLLETINVLSYSTHICYPIWAICETFL